MYAKSVSTRNGQYVIGNSTRPSAGPSGDDGSQMANAMIAVVVTTSGKLARLWRNGILLVRITWMISVCVMIDSTNQPVWNSDACAVVFAPNTKYMSAYVE